MYALLIEFVCFMGHKAMPKNFLGSQQLTLEPTTNRLRKKKTIQREEEKIQQCGKNSKEKENTTIDRHSTRQKIEQREKEHGRERCRERMRVRERDGQREIERETEKERERERKGNGMSEKEERSMLLSVWKTTRRKLLVRV